MENANINKNLSSKIDGGNAYTHYNFQRSRVVTTTKSFNEKHVQRSSLYCAFLLVYINFNFDLTKEKKLQTLYILFSHKNYISDKIGHIILNMNQTVLKVCTVYLKWPCIMYTKYVEEESVLTTAGT